MNELIWAIAQLGGFIYRPKTNQEPNNLIGMQPCYNLSNVWNALDQYPKTFDEFDETKNGGGQD